VTQRTAALPSLLAALDLVAGTYWIGRRAFDADVGFAAGLIAVTTAGVFSLARSPIPDMTLSLAMVAAVGAFGAAEFDAQPLDQLVLAPLRGIVRGDLQHEVARLQNPVRDADQQIEDAQGAPTPLDPPGAKN
jgi:4-amino-4-deoxy-L-arabinose transferase-like glycosyltransferase